MAPSANLSNASRPPAPATTPAPTPAGPRPRVRFEVAPSSRLWVAACVGLGGAFLFAAAFRSLAAALVSLEHRALEALFIP